ncbi:MAG: serine hydrolase [Polyangiaceae bacterium]
MCPPNDTNTPEPLTDAHGARLPDPTRVLQWSPQERLIGASHSANIYATETFHAGPSTPLPHMPPPDVKYVYHRKPAGAAPANAHEVNDVGDYMRRQRTAGLLVMKDGKIAIERYAPGIHERTLWQSMSVAKSVVSTLIGVALKEGKIRSLDETVDDNRYIPELRGTAYQGVTIRNMLRMSSGVSWNESYEDPNSDAWYLIATVLGKRLKGAALERMRGLTRKAEQGTVWHYSTGEAYLTGLLLERATGVSIAKYLEQKIWQPAKMEQNGVWIREADDGGCFGGIGFNATLRDYGRFAQLILNNGVLPNGTHLLPDNWVKDATTWTAAEGSPIPGFCDNGQYGYMWWFYPAYDDGYNVASPLMTKTSPVPLQNTTAAQAVPLTNRTSDWTFSGYGIYGQMMSINPIEKVVVIQFATWEKADPVDLTVSPDDPYNEEGVFVNAAIDALHR